ncbi:MAG: polysaccharide deacetylase family protein [Anaerolineae bacterium]|nr:polysaccharide deacetylase family protein [Anaerolineae bacterium]
MLTRLIRSKGPANLLRRAWAIVSRTGLRPRRMRQALAGFAELLGRYNARATFPVTAAALGRHPAVLRDLLRCAPAVELAVHGHRHTDLAALSDAEQAAEIGQAMALFRANGIPFVGFRAPYLRWNDRLLAALEGAGLWYDSSQCLLWPVIDEDALAPEQREGLQLLCDFCQPRPAEAFPALPFWINNLLEIPVSLPDDELLVERLRLRDGTRLAAVWGAALELCHRRGELFVLQLHPERFPLCAGALEALLQRARGLRPSVWLASLRDVTVWWREKRALHVELTPRGAEEWEVVAEGPGRGVLLVRGTAGEVESTPWGQGYRMVSQRRFTLRAEDRPCVGISSAAPLELLQFLADQGYVLEVSDRAAGYSVYLDRDAFSPPDMLPLLEEIEAAPGPLVRWARWPGGAGSALAITGDVDALTVWDYLVRPFEG